jgi:hypothetical protein
LVFRSTANTVLSLRSVNSCKQYLFITNRHADPCGFYRN